MQRGLRQGCPLSPLLFNLVAKSLPILVKQVEDFQWLQSVSIRGVKERITVLQYADDTIMFLG